MYQVVINIFININAYNTMKFKCFIDVKFGFLTMEYVLTL